MKIFLIGLMGSGKSFLGKKISQSLNLPFIDLDEEIEKQEGQTVTKIFSTKGKEYFRTIEAAALRKNSEAKEFVMATGGGTPCFHDNMNFIKQNGTSIFLDTPIKEILKRLNEKQRKQRPLIRDISQDEIAQTLEKMLEERLPFYEEADFIVNGYSITAFEILQLVYTKK
jgi:shikimate kinase